MKRVMWVAAVVIAIAGCKDKKQSTTCKHLNACCASLKTDGDQHTVLDPKVQDAYDRVCDNTHDKVEACTTDAEILMRGYADAILSPPATCKGIVADD